jgi:hypothetical protein
VPEHSPLKVHLRCSSGMPFSLAIRRRTSFRYSHLFLPGFIVLDFEIRCGKDTFYSEILSMFAALLFSDDVGQTPHRSRMQREKWGTMEIPFVVFFGFFENSK